MIFIYLGKVLKRDITYIPAIAGSTEFTTKSIDIRNRG